MLAGMPFAGRRRASTGRSPASRPAARRACCRWRARRTSSPRWRRCSAAAGRGRGGRSCPRRRPGSRSSARRSRSRPRRPAPPPQPVWNSPGCPGASPLKHGVLARRPARSSPWSKEATPGAALSPACELGLHRHLRRSSASGRSARCRGRSASRRTAGAACPTRCCRTGAGACGPGSSPTRRWRRRAWSAPCRPGRSRRADVVDAVVELLRAHARCARRCPSPRASRRGRRRGAGRRTCRLRLAKSYISSRKRLSPVQRHTSATALGNLIVSSVLKSLVLVPSAAVVWRVVAEPDRAVGDGLVDDDARAVVEDVGDVAQRAQVVLDRLELAERHRREAVYSPSVAKIHG